MNFLNILKEVKIIFGSPPQKEMIVYDNTSISDLEENLLKNYNYFLFEDRHYLITKIYISFKIFFYLIQNLNYGIKRAYKISIIKAVNPKLILTFIHNSENFSFLSKVLSKKYKFLAIQNASFYYQIREESFLKKKKKYFIPHLLQLSSLDKSFYKKSNWQVKKFNSVGSLRFDNFLKDIIKKKISIKKNKFDICLLSEVDAWGIKNEKVNSGFVNIIKYTMRYAKERKIKLAIALKRKRFKNYNIPLRAQNSVTGYADEQNWYKKNFSIKEYKYLKKRFIQNTSKSSYMCSLESKVTVACMSTILREIFPMNKKILSCNFTSNKIYNFPINGICSINRTCSYNFFKKRLDRIIKLKQEDYFKKYKQKKNFIMTFDNDVSTSEKIKNYINNYIK